MGVEHVHVAAEVFVGCVGSFGPLWIWMCIANELRHVDDAAEEVAEPVEVANDLSELFGSLWCAGVCRTGAVDAIDKQLGARQCLLSEGEEALWRSEGRDLE